MFYVDFLQPDPAPQSRLQGKHSLKQQHFSRAGLFQQNSAGSEHESVQEEGLFSTLNIQWLDITSLHSETTQ